MVPPPSPGAHGGRTIGGEFGHSSSISWSAPTTRPRRTTSSPRSARSFGAGGVERRHRRCTSSGPSTRTATSCTRSYVAPGAVAQRCGWPHNGDAAEVRPRRSWLCTSSAAPVRRHTMPTAHMIWPVPLPVRVLGDEEGVVPCPLEVAGGVEGSRCHRVLTTAGRRPLVLPEPPREAPLRSPSDR